MAIDFRCENCGKLLSVEAKPSSKIKCPYCKAKVVVPAGLASLPRPQVPGEAGGSDSRPDQPVGPPVEEEILVPEGSDALMGVMATLMPWVISLFFHAGVLVILAFIMIVTSRTVLKASVVVPDIPPPETISEDIAGKMSPELTAKSPEQADNKWAERDSKIPTADLGRTETVIGITGGAMSGGAGAPLGLQTGGGNKPRFYDLGGGTAYHIVYVIDCSGSMLSEFETVRREMIKSFSKLSPQQTFHVILFVTGKPRENPPRRLVFATQANKLAALKFLKGIAPVEGGTDPIPALKRAFAVLKRTPGKRKGKLIYLLTDGEFPNNEKVLAAIRALNAKRDIHINTILHHHHSPDVMKVLDQIAKENKGKFKFVEPNE